MKIAHLILVHKNPQQVERLIRALDHPVFDFFIHLDRKADIRLFEFLSAKENVFFIKNRVNIRWAGYGTIQATINGFLEIVPKGYDYINVISGQDFPLKPSEYIVQFFQNNRGKEFITCLSITDWKDGWQRAENISFVNWRLPGRFALEKIAKWFFQKPKFSKDYHLVGRANWFTLTNEAAKYILNFIEAHPRIVRFFKYTWGADELMMPTILYNSKFRDNIIDNLVYVDWTGRTDGHPNILTMEHLPALQQTQKLFARKFDIDVDKQILTHLEEQTVSITQ
jgi:hypothetical protein